LAATWVAGSGRPVIRRAASRTSRTLLERPDPMISGPTQRRSRPGQTADFVRSDSGRPTDVDFESSRSVQDFPPFALRPDVRIPALPRLEPIGHRFQPLAGALVGVSDDPFLDRGRLEPRIRRFAREARDRMPGDGCSELRMAPSRQPRGRPVAMAIVPCRIVLG